MDVAALGFAPGETPFDALPPMLEFPACFTDCPTRSAAPATRSRHRRIAVACDVVDMEAYALAKVCRIEGAEFACAKYVSDSADENAAAHWRENVAGAADRFLSLYRELLKRTVASRA